MTEPALPQIICGELRTGRILATVPCTSASWSVAYRGAGAVSATIPLTSLLADDRADLLNYLDPARCYLAARYGDTILEAGPIWGHAYDDDTGDLTINAGGLWSLFDHRKVVKVLGVGEKVAATSLTYTNLGLGTIAKRLVEAAQAHTGGSLPVVFQADETAGNTRTYPGHLLKRTGDALRDLTGVIGGPDIDFAPRLTTDRLSIEWVMRTGTAAQPLLSQSGGDWAWDLTIPRGTLSGLSVERDATRLGYRAYVPGSGIEADQPIALVEDLTRTSAGYPLLEVDEAHSSVTEQATLDAHASALLARSLRPWVTWSWQTETTDQAVPLGQFRPGDWASVNVGNNHPYLAPLGVTGKQRTRILAFSGDLGQVVKITTAPMMEVR